MASSDSARISQGAANRTWRNYLLDPRFQLKYTGMVVAVTASVASVLGLVAYRYSRAMTEMTAIAIANDPNADPSVIAGLEQMMHAQDTKTLLGIIAGVSLLALALGITGIVVTHKVVGPAYKLRMLIDDLGQGRMQLSGRLRPGDELQEVFLSLKAMVDTWRGIREEELRDVEAAIEAARASGMSGEGLAHLDALKARLERSLGIG